MEDRHRVCSGQRAEQHILRARQEPGVNRSRYNVRLANITGSGGQQRFRERRKLLLPIVPVTIKTGRSKIGGVALDKVRIRVARPFGERIASQQGVVEGGHPLADQ